VANLREMEGAPSPSVTQYTLFIILILVLGVVFGVITSIEANFDDNKERKKRKILRNNFNINMIKRFGNICCNTSKKKIHVLTMDFCVHLHFPK
jgi:uncharacterized membrane protein YqgA involved in biofilm formation